MRYETHGMRICYGGPIFITWLPDEELNVLFLGLFSSRKNDPLNEADSLSNSFGGCSLLPIDRDFAKMRIPLENLYDILLAYDDRRVILARDALASVDGVRVTMRIIY